MTQHEANAKAVNALFAGVSRAEFSRIQGFQEAHKMIAASHLPVNQVMTAHPGELLHMDIVGPSRVMSVGGKWYVLVSVDDFSCYSWVFFMRTKDEASEISRLDLEVEKQATADHASDSQ